MRFSAAIKYNTIHVGRVDVQMSVCLKVHKILPRSTPLQSSIPNHDIKQFAASHKLSFGENTWMQKPFRPITFTAMMDQRWPSVIYELQNI